MINGLFYNLVTKLLIVIIEHVNKQDMKYRQEILLVELLLKKEGCICLDYHQILIFINL
jgi:hypothetical protein